ncbi:hypothetical protein G3N94_08205 [Burkholderia sp. Ac-20353]|nr:hypothetical protein [Burkholderia sp. Ac-20353]
MLRRLQFSSGIVMLTYLAAHLFNHAIALWSLHAAGVYLSAIKWVLYSPPGTAALYGSAATHFWLALRSLYLRRSWAMTPIEWVRLFAGLSLPLLLIRHAVATRLAASLYAFDPNYDRVVVSLLTAGTQGLQIALLAPGWVHGGLGLWFRLRQYPVAQRAKSVLVAIWIAVPMLSAAGFLKMLYVEKHMFGALPALDPALALHRQSLESWRHGLNLGYVGLVILSIAVGHTRNVLEARRATHRPAG